MIDIMALIQYSALVNSMSGKLNGSVAAFNKGGSYLRNKGIVTNPNTPAQSEVRAFFSFVAASWRSLTDAQRASWNAKAASTPYTNRFGEVKLLSGFGLYQQRNLNLRTVGGAFLEDAPVDVALFQGSLNNRSASAGTGSIIFGYQDVANLGTWFPVIDGTPPISAGITNFNNKLRMLSTSTIGGLAPTNSFANANYASIFGSLVLGSTIGVGLYFVNSVTGQSSVETTYSFIVAA